MYCSFRKRIFPISIIRGFHQGQKSETEANGENLCLVQRETNDLELETRTVVQPKEKEVLIRVSNVCLCNDLENNFYFHAKYHNKNKGRLSVVPGSLATGIIAKTGTETREFQVGDRVVLEPGVSCLTCQYCSSGNTHLCPSISYIGTSSRDGALCKYMTHPAYFCHKLDASVPLDYATLTTKLACAIHGYEKAGISKESKVLIVGSNLLGLVTLMTLKHLGVKSIFVAELSNYRLERAKKLGADFVLKLAPQQSPEFPEYIKEVMQAIYAEPPDISIDTVGSTYTVQTAFHVTKSGGKILLLTAEPTTQAPFMFATLREMKIIGCYSYTRRSFMKALEIVKNHDIGLHSLSAIKVNLTRAIDAFSYNRAMEKENIITIIKNVDTEKGSYFKEPASGEMKTAAIPREPSSTKPLDKDRIQKMHKTLKNSVSQTISELSHASQEQSEAKEESKQVTSISESSKLTQESSKPSEEASKKLLKNETLSGDGKKVTIEEDLMETSPSVDIQNEATSAARGKKSLEKDDISTNIQKVPDKIKQIGRKTDTQEDAEHIKVNKSDTSSKNTTEMSSTYERTKIENAETTNTSKEEKQEKPGNEKSDKEKNKKQDTSLDKLGINSNKSNDK